jgi:hypothetical protein
MIFYHNFFKTAFNGLDTEPEPEPEIVKIQNRNRNKKLRFRNPFHSGNLSRGRDLLDSLESGRDGRSSDCQETPRSL